MNPGPRTCQISPLPLTYPEHTPCFSPYLKIFVSVAEFVEKLVLQIVLDLGEKQDMHIGKSGGGEGREKKHKGRVAQSAHTDGNALVLNGLQR